TANTAAPTITISAANATASASDCPLRNPPTAPVAISARTDHNSTIPRGASAVAESTSASAESRITGAGVSSAGDRSTTEPSTSWVANSGADRSTGLPPAVVARHGLVTD